MLGSDFVVHRFKNNLMNIYLDGKKDSDKIHQEISDPFSLSANDKYKCKTIFFLKIAYIFIYLETRH